MKKGIKTLLFIIALFLITSAAIPFWISTPSGTKTVVNWVNARGKGKLYIEKATFSWLGKQRFENVEYEDETKSILFKCPLLETKTSLFYLIFGGRSLGKTLIEEPYLYLKQTGEEKEKKEKAKKHRREISRLPTFCDTLLVRRGTLSLAPDHAPPVTISEISINKNAHAQHLAVKAMTVQGNVMGSLSVDASLGKKIQAKIDVKDFPVAILDNLTDSKIYTEALSPILNLELDLAKEKELYLNGSANSTNLTAYIDGVTEKEQFIINPKTHLDLIITPSLFKQLTDRTRKSDWELASKTTLNVQVERGSFPIKEEITLNNLSLDAKATVNRAELHHTTVGSYSLKQFDATVSAHEGVNVEYQGEIQGKESTKVSGHVSINRESAITFDYTCKGFPVTLLGLISDQLSQQLRTLFGNQFDLAGTGTFISELIDSQFTLHSPDIDLQGKVTGNIPEMSFECSGTRHLHGNTTKLIGNSLNFILNGVGKYGQNGFTIPFLKGNVFNQYVECDLRGQIGEEGKAISMSQVQLIALGNIKKLAFEEQTESPLENSTIYIQVDGSKNTITGKTENKAVEANFEIKNFIQNEALVLGKADITFTSTLSEFPLSAVNPFISKDSDLTLLLGNTISLTAKGSYTPSSDPWFNIDLNANGMGFSSSLSLAVDDTLIVKQKRPSYIYWEITPDRYAALRKLVYTNPQSIPAFALMRPTQVELNITEFTCPTTPPEHLGHFLCQSGFVGDIKVGATSFFNKKTNESITFQEITGSIKGENFSKAIDLALSGNIQAPNIPASETSSFTFNGQMFNFWSTTGKFNRESLTVKGELNVNLLPVKQITGLVPLDNETRAITQAVLGEFVNAHISGEISQLTGPITIDVKSSNFKARLPLQLQKNVLYLRDSIDAEITLTERVNESLLKDINPLLITGAFSDHPIKVYIAPQGFMLPIRPYSLDQVQIGQAVVDIGKIRVRNGGQIQSLMQFLNAKEITPDGLMEAWFTPIYVSLQNGLASYKRFDALLAGKVRIAMWGNVNLPNDRVKMTLAIAPTTLYERFKISGLKRKDMFQVQMGGTTDKLELDWSSAYTRIALIVARSAAGQLSSIVGGIIEQLVGNLGDEPAPPPTTDPLPWGE